MAGETIRPQPLARAGVKLARGVCRALAQHDFASLCEFSPSAGLRVDVMAVGPKGELWVVECKSSLGDLQADRKWPRYLEWCDRFFWAVPAGFPTEYLPQTGGLIVADAWGGTLVRMPEPTPLSAARRRALLLRFARAAAWRILQPDLHEHT